IFPILKSRHRSRLMMQARLNRRHRYISVTLIGNIRFGYAPCYQRLILIRATRKYGWYSQMARLLPVLPEDWSGTIHARISRQTCWLNEVASSVYLFITLAGPSSSLCRMRKPVAVLRLIYRLK